MDLNILSKNNLGAVVALFLVVILSQAKFFNFLLDTALGRAVLILLIIFISYTSKILGVVSVLFIIIMFNNSNIGYMEGNTTMSSAKKEDSHNKDSHNKDSHNKDTHNKDSHNKDNINHTEKAKTTNSAVEGFDIIGTEGTIKRGKPSNQIHVTKPSGSNLENFAPFSGTYSDSYSSF
jgi:hypothetical protein